ncbi:hypothetical protein [Roseococcus sp. YIM B11640]|uniref:hypothetical protein n=1 Tax=Roseococcus sp. YIM B11640 TaxID=3133973 RepID=UPI003C7C5897
MQSGGTAAPDDVISPTPSDLADEFAIRQLISLVEQWPERTNHNLIKLFAALKSDGDRVLLDEAIPCIARFTASDRAHARQLASLFETLGTSDRPDGIRAGLGFAAARPDRPTDLIGVLMQNLATVDPAAAAGWAERTMMEPAPGPVEVMAAAWILRSVRGFDDELAVQAMRRAILANPADPTLLRAWFEDRQQQLGVLEAFELMDRLAQEPGAPKTARLAVQRWRRHKLDEYIQGLTPEQAADCRAVWEDHLNGRPGDAEQWARVSEIPQQSIRAAMLSMPTRTIPLDSDHPYDLGVLREAGIDPGPLRQWARDLLQVHSPEWREAIVERGNPSISSHVLKIEGPVMWQDRFVRDGTLSCPCPLGGGTVSAFDSLYERGVIYYAFAGKQTFYFMAGGYAMRSIALWCPGVGILLSLGESEILAESPLVPGSIGRILKRVAENREASLAARNAPPGPREIKVVVRYIRNFAHQVWNMYSGIERLATQGLLGRASRVIHFYPNFFGPLAPLYPELPGELVSEVRGTEETNFQPFDTSEFIVPVGGYFMGRGLRRRINRAMSEYPPHPLAPDPADASGPVIWIGIRVTDKAWVDQENGIAQMCRQILAEYPEATFVIDGFTLPLGETEVARDWAPAMARMQEVVEGISAQLGRPDRIVSLVGQTMREAVIWAGRADAYVAPRGTSQHKVGWFSDAPGIIYTDAAYARINLLPGTWEAEGIPRPVVVSGVPDTGMEGSVQIRPTRPKMENIHLDATEVANALLALLRRRMGRS